MHLPFLALERTGTAPDLAKPRVSIAKIKGAQRLVALDLHARRVGLSKGMALADARAIAPDLDLIEHDPHILRTKLTAVADWCRRFTPLAALDAPNGVMLDITGVTHLFGGVPELMRDMETRLARQGITGITAVAATPEAAWALARFSKTHIAPDDPKSLQRLMSALPAAALRLDDDTCAALARAGLKQIGDIHMRPRAPIAARFGENLFARLDALLGQSKSPISPRFEAPSYMAERRFAEGVATRVQIEETIAALAGDLCTMLERHGEGARRLCATLFRVDGAVRHIHAGTSRPVRDVKSMARLFHERLEAAGKTRDEDPLDIGYGFDVIRLAVTAADTLDPTQNVLKQTDERAMAQETRAARMTDLVDRLGARLGPSRVLHFHEQDHHWPEHAVIARAAAQARPTAFGVHTSDVAERPLRLFEQPEPVEAIASVPDGPPIRFRWRRLMHEVSAFEGPERLSPQWWKQEMHSLTRDYFRIEDTSGTRFWIFREGLYATETARPRWYVHGLFA